MTYPAITPLPAAPQRTQDPDAFANTADTFVAALPDLVTDVNAAGAYIDNKSILVGNNFKGTYSAGTTYLVGESVLSSSKYYVSLVNANTGNTPASSPVQWSEIAGAVTVSGEISLTATGTITAGDLVSLLSNGTAIKSTDPEFDTPTQVDPNVRQHISVCHVPGTQKYVVAYIGASSFGTAVVVDYATGSAVIGTPVVFNSANTQFITCVYNTAQNVVTIVYYDVTATDVEAVAASISGTTLTFGASITVSATATTSIHTTYDSVNQAVVVAYVRTTSYTAVITASGTTLTSGAEVQISSNNAITSVIFDVASSKVLFSTTNNGTISLRVGTVSGTSISLGTVYEPAILNTSVNLSYPRLAYNSDEGRTYLFGFISQENSTNLQIAFVSRITISGTDPSLGKIHRLADVRLPSFFYSQIVGSNGVVYSSKDKAFYLLGNTSVFDNRNTVQFYRVIASGEYYFAEPSPFTPQITFNTGRQTNFCVDSDGSNFVVIGSSFASNTLAITRRSLAESTSMNWVGIAKASVTNGQTVSVFVGGGVATGLSSLTPGANYYTAGASYAKAGYEKIGKALSATSMLITG